MSIQGSLPLIILGRRGRARLGAHRSLWWRPDGGLCARIRGELRPVLLDAWRNWGFVWHDAADPGLPLAMEAVTRTTWLDVQDAVDALLRAHGEGWSPAPVLELARGAAADSACAAVRFANLGIDFSQL